MEAAAATEEHGTAAAAATPTDTAVTAADRFNTGGAER